MARAAQRMLTISGLLLIVLSTAMGYDVASPTFTLLAYDPNSSISIAWEVAAAAIVYLIGAGLLITATRAMPDSIRDSSASLFALGAIATFPVCGLLGFHRYWTEVGFILLALVLILAPLQIGFRRTA